MADPDGVERGGSDEIDRRAAICAAAPRRSLGDLSLVGKLREKRMRGARRRAALGSVAAQRASAGLGARDFLVRAANLRGEQRHGRGRHALDAAGLRHAARPDQFELGADLARKAGNKPIIERVGDGQRLIAPGRLDILRLTVEIDRIFGVDLDLGSDFWLDCAKFRPDRLQGFNRRVGQGQKIEGAAAQAILIDLEAMARRRIRA